MSEEQKDQARVILEATSKLPDALKEAVTAYVQGMAVAAKLMKEGMENKTA